MTTEELRAQLASIKQIVDEADPKFFEENALGNNWYERLVEASRKGAAPPTDNESGLRRENATLRGQFTEIQRMRDEAKAEVERLTAANERLSSLHEHGEVAMAKTIKELRAQLASLTIQYTKDVPWQQHCPKCTSWNDGKCWFDGVVNDSAADGGKCAEFVLKGAAPPAAPAPSNPRLTCAGCPSFFTDKDDVPDGKDGWCTRWNQWVELTGLCKDEYLYRILREHSWAVERDLDAANARIKFLESRVDDGTYKGEDD